MATMSIRSKNRPPSLKFINNEKFGSVPNISSPIVPPSVKTKLHHWAPGEVANELCVMDAERIRRIKPEELEGGAWMKKDKLTRAPNIMAMVYASNDLALLVPTEVLSESNTISMAKAITVFIQIASHCHKLNNFNSLKAILAGLQCTPIYRLKNTWKEVPTKKKKKFEELSQLMSEEYCWRAYSNHLATLINSTTPCVPFLGVLLTTTVQHQQGATQGTLRKRRVSTGVEDYTVLEAITVRNRLESIRKSVGKQPYWCTDDVSFITEESLSGDTNEDRQPRHRILSEIIGNSFEDSEINRSYSCEEICQSWVDDIDTVPILPETIDSQAHHIINGLDSPSIVIESDKTEYSSILNSNDTTSPSESVPGSNDLETSWILVNSDGTESPPPLTPFEASPLTPFETSSLTPSEASPRRPVQTSRASSTSSIPPMRKRSSCFSFKTSRRNSRFSQFSIEIPASVLKERRRASTLLGVLHNSKEPLELLGCYQFLSLGASAGLTSNPELRTIICNSHKNTEAVNYKMSYFREPS